VSGARVIVGLDQASRSGWGIALERGRVLHHGLARNHKERVEVIARAVQLAGGDPRRVFVMFEQHDHMPLSRLTSSDHTTTRTTSGRRGGVERGPKQIYGMGKAYGRWEAACDQCDQPESMRGEVKPAVWRSRIHGVLSGPNLKQAAIDWASRDARKPITQPDEAEGYCITSFAALDGIARHDAEKALTRVKARGERELKRQGTLTFEGE
jgi:hypothetical protein